MGHDLNSDVSDCQRVPHPLEARVVFDLPRHPVIFSQKLKSFLSAVKICRSCAPELGSLATNYNWLKTYEMRKTTINLGWPVNIIHFGQYPLVNIYKTTEHHHFEWENSRHFDWAMFNSYVRAMATLRSSNMAGTGKWTIEIYDFPSNSNLHSVRWFSSQPYLSTRWY